MISIVRLFVDVHVQLLYLVFVYTCNLIFYVQPIKVPLDFFHSTDFSISLIFATCYGVRVMIRITGLQMVTKILRYPLNHLSYAHYI